MRNRGRRGPIAAALGSCLLLAACGGGTWALFRGTTYPPPFNYVPAERLHSTMWRLAAATHELDQVVREGTERGEVPRERVLALLGDMEDAAAALGPGGWPSNHPRISDNVGSLREDIRRAKLAAAREPPSYYLAGSVSGACLYCH